MKLLKTISTMVEHNCLNHNAYPQFEVKRGLRNNDGSGVLAGLTKVGGAIGFKKSKGKIIPQEGQLYYRGFKLTEIVKGFYGKRHGFDETTFLLLTGKLPTPQQLKEFSKELASFRGIPKAIDDDILRRRKVNDIMNMTARSVLALYSYDDLPNSIKTENMMRQSTLLTAKFPTIVAHAYNHIKNRKIRNPKKDLTTAENFLYMLNGKYTELEAKLLDLCLVLHAEHGGGNNSSFTIRVVSSSQTDTYSAVAAALSSLKGPLHGGANERAMAMMSDIMKNVKNWKDEKELSKYILKILKKETFDKRGKIYGFGHAVYTLSDPRQIILKEKAHALAEEKGKLKEYALYALMEKVVPKVFAKFKGKKAMCANVDFYSGFVYDCLNIKKEVYTPLFAMARVAGWCSHRLEELVCARRLIRPAYKNVETNSSFVPLENRK